MHFLLQTINRKLVHDFTIELTMAKEYYDWLGSEQLTLRRHEGCNFDDVRNPDRYIPVGSVEFVSAYLLAFYPQAAAALAPMNVPAPLLPFSGRRIANITSPEGMETFRGCRRVFRKHLSVIKHPGNGIVDAGEDCTGYQVSELIDIDSEWRVFVFRGKIQHLANYSGDCLVFPDGERIREMVIAMGEDAPAAWTLDVGVTAGGGTVAIECHRFFSCGLYGFADHAVIPKMLSQEWFNIKRVR